MANLDIKNISNVDVTKDGTTYPLAKKLFAFANDGTQKEIATLYCNGKEIYRKRIIITLHTNSSYYAGSASQLPYDVTKTFTIRWGSTMNSTELTAAQAQANALFTAFDTNVASRKAIYSGLSYAPIISRTNANGPFYTASGLSGAVNLNTYSYSGTEDGVTLYCKWINNNSVGTSTNGTYYMPLFARSVGWWGFGHGGQSNGVGGDNVSGGYRKDCTICPPGHDSSRAAWSSTGYQGSSFYACYDGATSYFNYYSPSAGWQRYATSGQPGATSGGRYTFNVNKDTEYVVVRGSYSVWRRSSDTAGSNRSYLMRQNAPNATNIAGVRYMRFEGNGALVYNWPLYNVYYETTGNGSNESTDRYYSAYGAYSGAWPSVTGGTYNGYGRGATGGCAVSKADGSAGYGTTYGSAGLMYFYVT